MGADDKEERLLTSGGAMKQFKVSSCELSHFRQDGYLLFATQGNACLCTASAVQRDVKARQRERED